jgi:diaminopimelate epimerase
MSRAFLVSGGGNDFLALLAPVADPTAEEIVAWCARGLSVGADGVFTLRPAEPGRVAMTYWNADGQQAELCINGTRCAARLALAEGWAGASGDLVIETGAGPIGARARGSTEIGLDLPAPDALARHVAVPLGDGPAEGWFLVVGVPHLVLLWPRTLAECPVAALGARLRHHELFAPAGVNVHFIRFPAPRELEIRSYERGVEAETLACGSGVLAATAVGLQLGLVELPVAALTRGGFRLHVEGEAIDLAPRRWSLAGDARVLGRIELTPEAAQPAPPPPRWAD